MAGGGEPVDVPPAASPAAATRAVVVRREAGVPTRPVIILACPASVRGYSSSVSAAESPSASPSSASSNTPDAAASTSNTQSGSGQLCTMYETPIHTTTLQRPEIVLMVVAGSPLGAHAFGRFVRSPKFISSTFRIRMSLSALAPLLRPKNHPAYSARASWMSSSATRESTTFVFLYENTSL